MIQSRTIGFAESGNVPARATCDGKKEEGIGWFEKGFKGGRRGVAEYYNGGGGGRNSGQGGQQGGGIPSRLNFAIFFILVELTFFQLHFHNNNTKWRVRGPWDLGVKNKLAR